MELFTNIIVVIFIVLIVSIFGTMIYGLCKDDPKSVKRTLISLYYALVAVGFIMAILLDLISKNK